MQLYKDIDQKLPPDADGKYPDIYTSVSLDIWKGKYPYDTISMMMIKGQIPLLNLTLRESSIYNHLLVNYNIYLTNRMTGMSWNIQWKGVNLHMIRFSM